MEDALKKFKVAGAAVAVVKDGKIIHAKGYGVSDINTSRPVTETTNFQIASISKAFTSTALAILEDEGKLFWNDKVTKYIPEFKMYSDYVTENFTILDLLTHRSGLGLGVGDLMWFPDGADFTIQDVASCFQYFKPQSAFRTKFEYNNLLYIVAGEIVARASGLSYESFVQQRIIEPLQMNHTYVGSLLNDTSNLSKPHSSESGTIQTIEAYKAGIGSAAGGLYSNVTDMTTWMMVRLNKGKYGPDQKSTLFSLKNHNEMWRLHTVTENNPNPRYNAHFSGYGLGWDITDVKGQFRVSHTGGIPGMLSILTLYPDLNLGIVVLTNTETSGSGLFRAISNTIGDAYLGLDDFGWTDKILTRMDERKNKGDAVTRSVWAKVEESKNIPVRKEDYIGIFEDPWFGKTEVFDKDGQLWIKSYRSPKLNGPMYYYQANTFAVKWEYQAMNCDAFVMFFLDENGKAQSIKMKGISPNIDFSFDFHDLDLQRIP